MPLLECQKRTGSPFGVQGRFRRQQVAIAGKAAAFERTGDDGIRITLRFCPDCGSTLYWTFGGLPDLVAVAVGNFADPAFPAPRILAMYAAAIPGPRRRTGRRWSASTRCAAPPGAQSPGPHTLS